MTHCNSTEATGKGHNILILSTKSLSITEIYETRIFGGLGEADLPEFHTLVNDFPPLIVWQLSRPQVFSCYSH